MKLGSDLMMVKVETLVEDTERFLRSLIVFKETGCSDADLYRTARRRKNDMVAGMKWLVSRDFDEEGSGENSVADHVVEQPEVVPQHQVQQGYQQIPTMEGPAQNPNQLVSPQGVSQVPQAPKAVESSPKYVVPSILQGPAGQRQSIVGAQAQAAKAQAAKHSK